MKGKKVAFLGGDRREGWVMKALLEAGHQVTAWAWPQEQLPEGAVLASSAAEAVRDTQAAVLPLPPLGIQGQLHSLLQEPSQLDPLALTAAPCGLPVLTGSVSPWLAAAGSRLRLIPLAEENELAAPLAEATAEGALAEAITMTGGLLSGSSALILGFGRIGRALSWRLRALGVRVTVLNRGRERAEQARRCGLPVADWSQLTAALTRADLIVTTVPALLLDAERLRLVPKSAVIISLAAGAVDLEAAAGLGLTARYLPGLPGRCAPDFAGRVMAEVYLRRLQALWAEQERREANNE